MLHFQINPHSGVPMYRQMIDQIKHQAVAELPSAIRKAREEQVATSGRNTKCLMFLSLLGLGCSTVQGGWWDHRFDLPGANRRIQSLVEFRGALYAVGGFTRIAGVAAPGVARWDGTNWVAVEPGLNASVGAGVAAGEAMYFAAVRYRLDQPAGLLRWDGQVWTAPGTPQGYRDVLSDGPLLANGSAIYAEVFPNTTDGGEEFNNLACWDGSQWRSLGGGVSGGKQWFPNEFPLTGVRALLQDGSDLYVGGSFTHAGGVPAMNVARWDGSQWSAVGDGIPGYGSCLFGRCLNPVTSLALHQGKLFAGGGFTSGFSTDGHRGFLARWDGTVWTDVVEGDWTVDMGQPYTGDLDDLHVWALVSHDRDLYVAGNFGAIAERPSYGVAIWHEGNPPAIRLSLIGERLVLSWPRQFQFATVEFSESLASPLWRPDPNLNWEISTTATNDVEITITPASSQRFYRLGAIALEP